MAIAVRLAMIVVIAVRLTTITSIVVFVMSFGDYVAWVSIKIRRPVVGLYCLLRS